jgi:hypothetical protein
LGLVTTRTAQGGKTWITGASAVTDAEGAFELRNVPREGVHLDVSGDTVIPANFEVGPNVDPFALRLSVALRCHFRVLPDRAPPAGTHIELRDEDGAQVPIYVFESSVWSSRYTQGMDQEGSGVLAVSEDARALRVLTGWGDGQRTLMEQSVALAPHQVNDIRIVLP